MAQAGIPPAGAIIPNQLDPAAKPGQNRGMHITACVIELEIPGCRSLKEKRGRLLPVLARLQSEFGLAAAEVGRQDAHSAAVIACVAVSTGAAHNSRVLQSALRWIETHRPDLEIRGAQMEER
jgi:uncharacterized protein YlxP (DUF503 family)